MHTQLNSMCINLIKNNGSDTFFEYDLVASRNCKC